MTTTAPEPEEVEDDTIDTGPDETEEPEPYVPPTAEELAELKKALAKANGEAKKYRLAARSGSPADDDDDEDTPDPAKARAREKALARAAAEQAETTWKPRVIRAHALAALAGAGAKDPKRAARLIDQSDITFDDDGEPEGLDDQVDALKAEYPELFEAAKPKRPRPIDAGPKTPGGRKLSATERQLQQAGLLG